MSLGFRRWAFPFVVIGMNAIAIYVAWEHFVPFSTIAKNLVGGLAGHLGSAGPFVIALTAVLLMVADPVRSLSSQNIPATLRYRV